MSATKEQEEKEKPQPRVFELTDTEIFTFAYLQQVEREAMARVQQQQSKYYRDIEKRLGLENEEINKFLFNGRHLVENLKQE